ncbi:MAG: DUF6515 family protein [Steroidobacteraceae bacterium]
MSRTMGMALLAVCTITVGTRSMAAEEERPRAEAQRPAPGRPAPARPAAVRPGVPARPVVDGRGQVMDARYNHGRFYAPVGTVARTLPPDYRPYYRGGSPYYFSGGVWYAPRAGGFVVISPPVGLVIGALPGYYTTVWVGGVPYYYADNVYYTWQPDQNGYAVVPPPDGAPPPDGGGGDPNQAPPAAAPPPPAAQGSDLIVYPANGQSKDQQAADQYECHNWAKGQTGFDPTQPDGGVPQGNADQAHSNYDRAMAACLTGRGYQVN